MADPVLDEESIVMLLQSPASIEYVAQIQAGAVQALIDGYDRKLTRDEFVQLASPCIALYGQVMKLWLLHNIKEVFDNGDLDESRFTKASAGISDLIRHQALTLIEQVERMRMCPTSKDPVH